MRLFNLQISSIHSSSVLKPLYSARAGVAGRELAFLLNNHIGYFASATPVCYPVPPSFSPVKPESEDNAVPQQVV